MKKNKLFQISIISLFLFGCLGAYANPKLSGIWQCTVDNSSNAERPDRFVIDVDKLIIKMVGLRKNSAGIWNEVTYPFSTETTMLSNRQKRSSCQIQRQDFDRLVEFTIRCGSGGAALQLDVSNNIGHYAERIPPRINLYYSLVNCLPSSF